MFTVGLTGGIGCGKTTISNLFKDLNVPVLDADTIAHELVEPGQPALAEIATIFGPQALKPDGSLDRDFLREIVFSDSDQKQKLEAIMHPRVFSAITEKLAHIDAPYCVVSIPLLFETQQTGFVNRVLVADCPIEVQVERVRQRDRLSVERIMSIIDSQVSREYRLRHADDILDNSKGNHELAECVKKLHNSYLSISAS